MLLTLLLSFCVSCGQIGFGPPDREIEKIYSPAEDMYNGLVTGKIRKSQANWNNVIRQFGKVVKNHSKSRFADDAQYKIGASYIQANGIIEDSLQKAIKAFDRLIKRYPDSEFVDDAYYWKAHAHFLREDYEQAITEYEEFISQYPKSELHKDALNKIEDYRVKIGGEKESPVAAPPPVVVEKKDEKPSEIPTTKTDAAAPEEDPPTKPPKVENQQEKPDEVSRVVDIKAHSSPEFTRVVVELSGPVKYTTGELKDPDRLYLDIQTATITPAKRTIPVNDKFIKQIRVAQFNETTVRIVLDLEQN